MLSPRYRYAQKRILDAVATTLTHAGKGKVTATRFPGSESLFVEDRSGPERRSGEVSMPEGSGMIHSLAPALAAVLAKEYPDPVVSALSTVYAGEYDRLWADYDAKIDALPTKWVRDVPGLAKYDGPLEEYTGGHIMLFKSLVFGDHNAGWIMELLGISRTEFESIRAQVKNFLPDSLLEAEKKLNI